MPPEWGGGARGGVATFHAGLVTALASHPMARIVGVVTPAQERRDAPVPVFFAEPGENKRRLVQEVVESTEPDVVLLNNFVHGYAQLVAEVAPELPRIGIAHSWHVVTFAPGTERDTISKQVQARLDALSALVVGSRHCEAEGLALGFEYPERTETIHYPLSPAFAEDIDVQNTARAGVVYLGSLIARKDPAVLLAAAELLPDVGVTFAGEGPEEGDLWDAIAAQGLAGRVVIEPHRAPGEHITWLRQTLLQAEVMCLPSRSESFGLVFVEALACGTPVVGFAPTVREIQEAMGVEIGEPVEAVTAVGLASAIQRVRERPWDREHLREAALRAFDLESVAQAYARLCHSVDLAGDDNS